MMWGHVAGCGGMWKRWWQGVVAGVGVCGRGSGLCHGWRHMAGVETCGRMWGHVAGCGGMWQGWWQGWGYVVGGQAYGMDGDMLQGNIHMVGCGGMWQGVGACGRGWGYVVWGQDYGIDWDMWQGWGI